jgi:ribosomal protein S18 acetylase RimI-like enzyme
MFSILRLSQLSAERRREVAALLFAHLYPQERNGRIEQWLAAVANNELNSETILTGWWDDCVAGVQVVEILAGNAAALWAIRTRPGDESRYVEDTLLQAAFNCLRNAGVKVAQCLLAPEESAAADALCRHGCRSLTAVRHLRSAIPATRRDNSDAIAFLPYRQVDPARFKDILAASFEGALDCPELNDLRTPDEILAGHVESATDFSRWWLIQHRGEPAGVLILADAALPELWDLAYVGVLPAFRRRGIGRAALQFAMQQAAIAGKEGISLMVDERNLPALELYTRSGFQTVGVRDFYLWISPR